MSNARRFMLDQGIKLHIGCGATHFAGWENVDYAKHGPHVDTAFDLMADWPYEDNSVSAVYASHVLEHLPNPLHFFRELWRVMMPMSSALLRFPHGGHKSAWADITHLRAYYPESFAFLQPGYAAAIGNPQLLEWTACFGLACVDVRIVSDLIPLLKRYWFRKLFIRLVNYMPAMCEEIFLDIFPLKTADAQAEYRATHTPNLVPMRYITYRHEWEQREIAQGEATAMVPIAEPRTWDTLQRV